MMKLFHQYICLFAILTVASIKAKKTAKISDCSINLTNDIKGFSPVILTRTTGKIYELFKPAREVTYLKAGSRLKLVCAGTKNVFVDTDFHTLELKCLKGNFVDLNNNIQPLNELLCKNIPISSLKITNDECANGNGYIYESGFMMDGEFYGPVFAVCYNNITETTLYTHNTLNGAAIDYSISESYRRSFTADGMQLTTAEVNNCYMKKNQIKRFEDYFGTEQNFLDNKNFLARGHLTADADFIFPYEQLATYYYVNAAPQFQVVNAGNWLRVEALARATSAAYKDDIESYNSYMGVLKLPNANGDAVEIFLDDKKKIAPPEFYYKVLLHRASESAIVFVTINNPYINNGAAVEFCTNVCKESGLVHANFPDVKKGYTFCCELNDFKLSLDSSLPDDLQSHNLLKRKI